MAIQKFEVCCDEISTWSSFEVKDCEDEDAAWDAAVRYALKLAEGGVAPESIYINEIVDDSVILIRSYTEIFEI